MNIDEYNYSLGVDAAERHINAGGNLWDNASPNRTDAFANGFGDRLAEERRIITHTQSNGYHGE